jgi:hypothetical protein
MPSYLNNYQRMPSYLNNYQSNSIMEDITCTVCLSTIDKKDPNNICTPCGHLFHKACIKPWVEQKLRDPPVPCPTCRHDISLIASLLGLSEERKSYLDEYNAFRNAVSPLDNLFSSAPVTYRSIDPISRQFSSFNSLRSTNFVNANNSPIPRAESWLPMVLFNNLASNSQLRTRRQEGDLPANAQRTVLDVMRAREQQMNRTTHDIMMTNDYLFAQKNLLDTIIQLEDN